MEDIAEQNYSLSGHRSKRGRERGHTHSEYFLLGILPTGPTLLRVPRPGWDQVFNTCTFGGPQD